jgi:uncharacterized membrane protein
VELQVRIRKSAAQLEERIVHELGRDVVQMRSKVETQRESGGEHQVASHEHVSRALQENLDTIKGWEQAALHDRTPAERLSDDITRFAGGGRVLVLHVVWYSVWILVNARVIPGLRPFDPFPFPLLTTAVSLEAIFLSLFVLASQNRLAHQADKRAHLDLQIDLLAEREMTIVLRLLQDIVKHLDIKASVTPRQIVDLIKTTDIHELTARLDEIPEPGHEGTGTPGRKPRG